MYGLPELMEIKKAYDTFIDNSEGFDPDFPTTNFGGGKGKKISGTNVHTLTKPIEDESEEDAKNAAIPIPNKTDAGNTTVEERALNFLKNLDKKK